MITHVFNSSIVSGPEMLVLPALRNLGAPVSVVFLTESRRKEEAQKPMEYARSLGHEVHAVNVAKRWDPTAFVALRSLLDKLQSRIVHAHDVKASVYLYQAKKIKAGFNPKLVSTHHGTGARHGRLRLYEELYVRLVLPRLDHTLAVCTQDANSILGRGVPASQVSLHLNGTSRRRVEPGERQIVSRQIRNEWKLKMPSLPDPSTGTWIGAVARLSPEKRHDRMLRVLKRLTPTTILLCFGTGPEEKTLRVLAKKLGLESRVFWMGYSQSISNEMSGFDLLMSLSDGEGIPLSLLEAGWAATPVLSTDVGGIPDLISSSELGILVDKKMSDTQIARVLSAALLDRDRLVKVGEQFQAKVVKEFSESAWLNRLREIYYRL